MRSIRNGGRLNHKDPKTLNERHFAGLFKESSCAFVSSWLRFLFGPAVIRVLTHYLQGCGTDDYVNTTAVDGDRYLVVALLRCVIGGYIVLNAQTL